MKKKQLILLFYCLTYIVGFSREYNLISTQELKKIMKKENTVVVDTRITDVYNGWDIDIVGEGGHIEGATDFSAQWLSVDLKPSIKDEKLSKVLKEKKIIKENELILYDTNGKDSKVVADYLNSKGYKNISLYDLKEGLNSEIKLNKFPNYKKLVPAIWIQNMIEKNNSKYKVFEVAWGPEDRDKDYINGHIKGAVHIDTDEIESPPLWSINTDKKLIEFAVNNGITKEDKIILYSTDTMASFRIGIILEYLGVQEVRILNGGLKSWKNAKLPLETKRNPKMRGTSFGAEKPINKNLIIEIEEAKKISESSEGQLVDIRAWDEHIGKISGYSDINYKGRPKNSIWGKAGSSAITLEDYRNIDGTMRNGNEIINLWKELGIDSSKNITFFCGSGWRAAEVLIYSQILGVKNASLYSNGWYEWGFNKKNPIEVGEKK
ncbi:MAG: rhodanese-like domain-containing protein [Fusobacteriaceae bacterium]